MIALKHESITEAVEDEKLFSLASGSCFDFHKKSAHLFVVGTEEGHIYKCSKEHSSEHLLSFIVRSDLILGPYYVRLHSQI